MERATIAACRAVIKSLGKKPAAAIIEFCENSGAALPATLRSMEAKLDANAYSKIIEFDREARAIWKAIISSYGAASIVGLAAQELARAYEKEVQRLRILTLKGWSTELIIEREKLRCALEGKPPIWRAMQCVDLPWDDDDDVELARVGQRIEHSADCEQLARIMRWAQPEIVIPADGELRVDVHDLLPRTKGMLLEFAEGAVRRRG